MAGPKKMTRGFMCQSSTAATAACMTGDPRHPVIVPRKHLLTTRTLIDDSSRLIATSKNANYSTLAQSKSDRFLADQVISTKKPLMRSYTTPHEVRRAAANDEGQKPKQDMRLELKAEVKPEAASQDHLFQVVVMRVSLHCQGCAGKVKKHLSKMKGVTSFSIDLETKMVTVRGHVSPVGVLESVSKVKRAEFWPR